MIEQCGVDDVGKANQTIINDDLLIGESEAIERLKTIISNMAALHTTVMIYGEPGTGKELVARMIHNNSPNAAEKFLPLHPAALPHTLLPHVLDRVQRGTLYIDDLGDTNAATQTALLRLLQQNSSMDDHPNGVNTTPRIIAATGINLKRLAKSGDFRQDLFYRLNIITLEIPPLRERREDIPLLARHFINRYSKKYNVKGVYLLPNCVSMLQHYDWPGNIDELKMMLERLVFLLQGKRSSQNPILIGRKLSATWRLPTDQALSTKAAMALHKHDSLLRALRQSQCSVRQIERSPTLSSDQFDHADAEPMNKINISKDI